MIERIQSGTQNADASMEESKKMVDQNVAKSEEMGQTLTSIKEAVGTISHMNTKIARGTETQAQTTKEVNSNIKNIMDAVSVSSENTLLADKATDELKSIAKELGNLIKQFKI